VMHQVAGDRAPGGTIAQGAPSHP